MPEQTLSQESIQQFLDYTFERGRSPQTVLAYGSDLKLCLTSISHPTFPSLENEMARWLTANRHLWSPRTTKRRLAALRSWGRWAGHPTILCDYAAPTPAAPVAHPLPEGEAGVVRMALAGRSPAESCLVALCGLAGLRVGEACDARPGDIADGRILIHGKGAKERSVPISSLAMVFVAPRMTETRLVPYESSWARELITMLGERANICRRVSSHDLRATFATEALKRTNSLRAVQILLGHASSKTTEAYTAVDEELLLKAIGEER